MDATRVPTSEPIDIYEDVHPGISADLEETFRDFPPDVGLPFTYGDQDGQHGPPVDDPLLMDISLPAFSGIADMGPTWRISLQEMLDDEIDFLSNQQTGQVEGEEEIKTLRAIVRRLREIADRVAACIPPDRQA